MKLGSDAPIAAPATIDRLLSLREVMAITSLGKTTIYRKMAAEQFPRPVSLGSGCVRWKESNLAIWIASLPETSSLRPLS